ncbi:MAG TPA: thioredoxin domain-containing protein [Acidobacteriaceae bacterium]|nr:thioredoxin domain-containing protein [Acidobacteriaceae bacterium]
MTLWKLDSYRPTNKTERARLFAGAGMRCGMAAMACVLLACTAAAQDKTPSEAGPPLAIIDGQPVYEDQLPPKEVTQLQRMMSQVYGVKIRALHETLDQKLIDAAAKKKGVSQDELFKSEVLSKVPEPTDDQVKANYESRQDLKNKSFDEVKDRVRQDLKNEAIDHQKHIYIEGLWQQAVNNGDLSILLTPPRIEVIPDRSRMRGNPNAPITIVEFSDFSCPFCFKAEAAISAVMAQYPDQVKLSYRDFPLRELHPNAESAAEAARCAGDQGKFWEYHDLLFADQKKQTPEGLMNDARTLKLDEPKFAACLDSGRYKQQIELDVQMGSRAGVEATPGFFINDTFVNGAQPPEVFERIIDKKLAALKQSAAK